VQQLIPGRCESDTFRGSHRAIRTHVVGVDLIFGVAIVHGVLDPLWSAATRHPFLDAVRDGTIADAAFDRWLAQDALFVADLLAFQARLLGRAPRQAHAALADGCVALVAELDWFEVMATRRGIDLGATALPATLAYRALLLRLDAAPYTAAVTALWVLERVYLLGWASAASSTSPFGEFVEHWTAPGFAGYVDALGELATLDGQDDLVADVLTHEVAFWDMALA
jgi:thiaminase